MGGLFSLETKHWPEALVPKPGEGGGGSLQARGNKGEKKEEES